MKTPGQLPRAGWKTLAAPAKTPPPELEADGQRLVATLAASWCERYDYNIRSTGYNDGGHHYECIFSRPQEELPVPNTIVRTRFCIVAPQAASDSPKLLFSFEEGDLRHVWQLHRDASGKWQATVGQQDGSLRHGYFEKYLDRYVAEKKIACQRGISLVTPFEESRLPPPAEYEEEEEYDSEEDSPEEEFGSRASVLKVAENDIRNMEPVDPEMAEALRVALQDAGLACNAAACPTSLSELLGNVFDAADEEDAGELPHYEVSLLLGATLSGLGLEPWDIQLLLTSAQENHDGLIDCKAFIQAAPEVIQELRRRRLAYKARGLPGIEISPEAVQHCFGLEAGDTAIAMQQLFAQWALDEPSCAKYEVVQDLEVMFGGTSKRRESQPGMGSKSRRSKESWASKRAPWQGGPGSPTSPAESLRLEDEVLVGLKRRACRACLLQLPTRVSPQDAHRLMQMMPEDEDGFVLIDQLSERLEELRTGALLNALVESDPTTLRKHLVLCFRHAGMTEEGKMKLWQLKQALLMADQICLSQQQVHALLCLAVEATDAEGNVSVSAFAGMCSVVIPHMFDAKLFVETADRLQVEAAEQQRLRENAEIAALGAAKKVGAKETEEETKVTVEVDPETVEKTLIQVFSIVGDTKTQTVAPQTLFTTLHNDAQIQGLMLSEYELCGFAAEMISDVVGQVAYVEHVKRSVPMLFELRRNQLLSAYVQPDAREALGIPEPDLTALEKLFPLLPRGVSKAKEQTDDEGGSVRLSGRQARSSKQRPSQTKYSKSALSPDDLQVRGRIHAGKGSFTKPVTGKATDTPMGRGYQRRRQLLGGKASPEPGET